MPTIPELAKQLNLPLGRVQELGEAQVLNPKSSVFQAIRSRVAAKFLAAVTASKADAQRRRPRAYVSQALSPSETYELVSTFKSLDIKFNQRELTSAPLPQVVAQLTVESIVARLRMNKGTLALYGVSLEQIILRGKTYAHLCIPAHNAAVQAAYVRSHQVIHSVVLGTSQKQKSPGVAQEYVKGQSTLCCMEPDKCDVKANVGVMMLHGTDTNFRQVAYYMHRKQMKLAYICFFANKHMEMCTPGPHQLGGYVIPSDDDRTFSLTFDSSPTYSASITHSNYLELIARTRVVIAGKAYHKEFDSMHMGMAVYKITQVDQVDLTLPVYRSWNEPTYKSKYMLYAPVLVAGGVVSRREDWMMVSEVVDKAVVDDLIEFAQRAQGAPDLAAVIQRRLRSLSQGFDIAGQTVRQPSHVSVRTFDLIVLVVFVHVFQRRFKDGAAISTLAPFARQIASLSQLGTTALTAKYVQFLVASTVRGAKCLTGAVRRAYYDSVADHDLHLPTFAMCPGYVEYSDSSSSNPRFNGWLDEQFSGVSGFSNKLPGLAPVFTDVDKAEKVTTVSVLSEDTKNALLMSGEAFEDGAEVTHAQRSDILDVAFSFGSTLWKCFNDDFDVEVLVEEQKDESESMVHVRDTLQFPVKGMPQLFKPVLQRRAAIVDSTSVRELTDRIAVDVMGTTSGVQRLELVDNEPVSLNGTPQHIPGARADLPKQYMFDGLKTIFPDTFMVDSEFNETDKALGAWEVVCKAIRVKLDVSKLEMGKPESYYAPALRGHIQPNVKNSMVNTFLTVWKRNANTPVNADPLDVNFLWQQSWLAVCKVFYLPNVQQLLDNMPTIAPDVESIAVWVSALDEAKRKKLFSQPEGFMLSELVLGANRNQLMLKAALKPVMDASYASAIKMPQSLQYDPTGKTVAVMSPLITEAVRREQSVLKPNMMVMQRKSPADVKKFVNSFNWLPNEQGERRYIEIDFEMYDKSQSYTLSDMYLRFLEQYGMIPNVTEFIRLVQNHRTASGMKAGVSVTLAEQNPSGASYTLDRNNKCNMLSIAEKLASIQSQIEFVIMMGDDVVIAVRGAVDISSWEADIARKFNLSLKANIHEHGYICSMEIVHLPKGRSTVVADPIKRALAFMAVSHNDENLFHERFVSYKDNMMGIDDIHVQQYLASAIPARLKSILPTITADSVLCLLKAHATLMTDFTAYRAMFAKEKTVRFF